jgi:tRNA(Ile)-lysidine synthase
MVAEGADRLGLGRDLPLVLAVSGGADSMALLHGAASLAPGRGWQLVVAHLDHGLRTDSADDARFVAEAAEALGLPWEMRRTDVGSAAAESGTGIEEAGRQARSSRRSPPTTVPRPSSPPPTRPTTSPRPCS